MPHGATPQARLSHIHAHDSLLPLSRLSHPNTRTSCESCTSPRNLPTHPSAAHLSAATPPLSDLPSKPSPPAMKMPAPPALALPTVPRKPSSSHTTATRPSQTPPLPSPSLTTRPATAPQIARKISAHRLTPLPPRQSGLLPQSNAEVDDEERGGRMRCRGRRRRAVPGGARNGWIDQPPLPLTVRQ
jgi:hypothetical protein